MFIFPPNVHKIGLAVSGGADSAVMMHYAQNFQDKIDFTVLTIDHKLRAESATEVLSVQNDAKKYGFKCHILSLNSDNIPPHGIQNYARKMRYNLLSQTARHYGLDMVCIAHHRDDIYETLLSRLLHHSGMTGLSPMRPFFYHQGVWFHRPMLNISRDDIDIYAGKHHLNVIHDPSNLSEKYERTHIRACLNHHSDLKLSLQNLYNKTKALYYLNLSEMNDFISHHVTLSPYGYVVIPKSLFLNQNIHTQHEILRYSADFVTGTPYSNISHIPDKNMTLSGAYFHVTKDFISVFRENRNLPCPVPVKYMDNILYDNRFIISAPTTGTLSLMAQNHLNIPVFCKKLLPCLITDSGKIYDYDDLKITYQPQSLESFNSNPILHHKFLYK